MLADSAVVAIAVTTVARPRADRVPGHTRGSVGFAVPDRDVCFSGDALVTLDLLTGRRGPRLIG
jgi:glyoxylase-like metal-dependent hydrolase (beta-lactamase superfamily II)